MRRGGGKPVSEREGLGTIYRGETKMNKVMRENERRDREGKEVGNGRKEGEERERYINAKTEREMTGACEGSIMKYR